MPPEEVAPVPAPESAPAGAPSAEPPSRAGGSPPAGADLGAGAKPKEEPKPATSQDYAAVSRERERLRQARKELGAKTTELEAKHKAEAERAAKLEADMAAMRAELEEARTDGLMYSTKHGKKAEELIRKYVGATAPEQLAAGAISEVEALKRELAEFKKSAADRELKESQAKEQLAKQQSEQAALARVAGAFSAMKREEKKCPYVFSEWSEAEIQAKLREVDSFAISKGASYTFDEVMSFLDKAAKTVYDQRAANRARLLAEEAANPGSPPGIQVRASRGNGPPGKSEPATRTAPKSLEARRRLTREEEEAQDLAMLRKASAEDAKSRNGAPSKTKSA